MPYPDCHFPFKYHGKIYHFCTEDVKLNNYYQSESYILKLQGTCLEGDAQDTHNMCASWCALSANGTDWGICQPSQMCRFPFWFEGQWWNKCTYWDNGDKPWCITHGGPGEDSWGICDPDYCEIDFADRKNLNIKIF